MSGRKDDEAKLRVDLIPPDVVLNLAKVLTYGASKYAPRNWENGIAFSRVYGALLRHLLAWWGGEDIDPETGINHVHHALCNATFLSHYVNGSYRAFDNRPSTLGGDNG